MTIAATFRIKKYNPPEKLTGMAFSIGATINHIVVMDMVEIVEEQIATMSDDTMRETQASSNLLGVIQGLAKVNIVQPRSSGYLPHPDDKEAEDGDDA